MLQNDAIYAAPSQLIMPDPIIRNRRAAAASKSRHPSGALAWCLPFKASSIKQRTSYKLLIIWPLVVLGLIQVTSSLINSNQHNHHHHHHHHTSSQSLTSSTSCQDSNRLEEMQSHIRRCTLSESSNQYNQQHRNHIVQNPHNENSETMQECSSILQNNAKSCSSTSASEAARLISLPESLLTTASTRASPTYLRLLYHALIQTISWSRRLIEAVVPSVPKVLLADAANMMSTMYQPSHDKEIIVLNATNFNNELVQFNHPFRHIKLIEYYLPYCGICLRFKQTYIRLSKDISSWRNVLRPSAIDLGVSNNSPIANSWSIEVVPTLRIHPPPKSSLAEMLNNKLQAWHSKSLSPNELQRAMYEEYNGANLMISSLGVIKYTNDSKRDNIGEKVSLLKMDLLRYVASYAREHPDDLPETWPNLRPVSEKTLLDLRRHHPRQELFLIIEAGGSQLLGDTSEPSLGLQIMMELSSSAAWKAIRYVRAGENRELVEDVIAHKKKELSEQTSDSQNNSNNQNINQQLELLNNLFVEQSNPGNNVILIHIDDSHSPFGHANSGPSTKFPYLTIITSSDLVNAEQQLTQLDHHESGNVADSRTKRDATSSGTVMVGQKARRSLFSEDEDLSSKRKIELVTLYVNQTYIETKEDREFLSALASFDEHPTVHSIKREAIEKFQATQQDNKNALTKNIEQQRRRDEERKNVTTSMDKFLDQLNPTGSSSFLSPVIKFNKDHLEDDYEDKLKAIRYIFFQEVPRKSVADKSPAEKLEKLNTLINLATVIKAYFPMPDLASVQFIDAVYYYLLKQQTQLVASMNNPDRVTSNFDLRSLKQVIKNIEAEGKRLPEIRNWKHCKSTGYPCALWRLFHTLTAFEYKKLNQINQLLTGLQQQQHQHQQLPSTSVETQSPGAEQIQNQPPQQPQAQVSEAITPVSSTSNVERIGSFPPAPVERVVSPPSTTTSLSLTIATPISSYGQQQATSKKHAAEMAELPMPVLLVMRDYITNFFSCEECAKNFSHETADLSFERIRQQEPAEFSIMWLWETHNRVSKRLSINPETNPPEHPKQWYPTYEQCPRCYKKPPSYLKEISVELAAIFHESIEWDRDEVLSFLQREFTRQPMDAGLNIFGYPVPYGFNYIIVIGLCSLLLIVLLRCASCYIERQRRHKASMLNGNGVEYSVELQRC